MNSLVLQMLLFAQNDFFEDISRRARKPTMLTLEQWCVICAALFLVIVITALGSWYSERKGKPRRCNSPKRLFWSLCRAHDLSWRDRWILWRLSRYQELDDPARLFLEPHRFDSPNLSFALQRHPARIASLRERLFANPWSIAPPARD